MPRPMLKKTQQTQTQSADLLSATKPQQRQQQQQQIDKMKLDRLLRRPRSKAYMEALHGWMPADIHIIRNSGRDHTDDPERTARSGADGILLGFVSMCYLGRPYEVHTLDMTGEIIKHYKAGQPLPDGLEKARGIAMRGGYEFIEVYADCCRAVSANGAVSVIPG